MKTRYTGFINLQPKRKKYHYFVMKCVEKVIRKSSKKTYHQVIPLVARGVSVWNLEGLFKVDSNGQATLDLDMPRAVEIGCVGLRVPG